MNVDPIVIVGAKRTPIGAFQGNLKQYTSTQLGAEVIRNLVDNLKIDQKLIDNVLMGCVLSAGLGQSPARQAALGGGLPLDVHTITISKVCGSGLQSVMIAADMLKADSAQCIIAGGMESMTQAPYLLDKARSGYRLGHGKIIDHMYYDGLEDAYQKGCLMGVFAEDTALKYNFSRQEQDTYAIRTIEKARQAQSDQAFTNEIIPLKIKGVDTPLIIDEPPTKGNIEKIPLLKPVFRDQGTVTAATSSAIADGAAAVMVCRESFALKQGLEPLARIISYATHSQEPAWYTTAPVMAIKKALGKAGWTAEEVGLYEINEAFAVVPMAVIKEVKLDPEKVNVHGGACALGHPIGASGARVLVTLIHAMQRHHQPKGIASLCIGGGEGVAMAIELY